MGPRGRSWMCDALHWMALMAVLTKGSCSSGGGGSKEDMVCNKNRTNSHLCLPEDYNKFDLPFKTEGNVIDIGIDIVDVLRIQDKEYSVEFSCYFNVMWTEPRLVIPSKFQEEFEEEGDMVPVNVELVNHLWLPNIFIYNLKTFKVVQVLSKHAGLWVTKKKEIMYSQATHINFICPMRFDAFPLDTQACKFQVGSYSYDITKMSFAQSNKVQGYVKTANSVVLDYSVKVIPLSSLDVILDYGELGNFSVAGFEMILRRHISHYLITYYLPSGLFVVVSWISFVVPPDVIPGRMALLITLFLVLVNIFNTVTTNTPKAEGLTAIEAWMLSCILFVFGALVEYAVILFNQQKQGSPNNRRAQHVKIVCKENLKYEVTSTETKGEPSNILPLEEPRKRGCTAGKNFINVDRVFLLLSPFLFLLFNCIYWYTYGAKVLWSLQTPVEIPP